jgi:iron complex outermembrane receptor protein
MSGVDTYKNTTADMIEGGLAGTVNLKTALPFDSQGFVGAFSGEVGYGTLAEEANPSGSALLMNRWETGIGDIGFMANVAYSNVVTESQGVQLLRFFRAEGVAGYGGGTKWIPGGVDIRSNTYDRTRTGVALAAQWASPEEALSAVLQYNRSEYENNWEEYSLGAGIGNAQNPQGLIVTNEFSTNAAGTPEYEFDSRGTFVRGVINEDVNLGWYSDPGQANLAHPNGYPSFTCYSWSAANCPTTRGVGLGVDTRSSEQTNTTEDLSLNFKWAVSERVGLNFDVQTIDSTVVNFDNSSNNKTATDLYLDISGKKPYFEFRAPTGYGFTAGGFSDPQNYFKEWQMEHAENSYGEELALRLDADIKIESGWADSLRIGVRRAEREQNVNWSTYNWGAVQPLWGVQADVPFFLNQAPWAGTYQEVDLGSDMVGGGVFGGGTFLHPSYDIVSDYDATRDLYGGGRSNSWVALADRTACPVQPGSGGLYCPVEMLDVTEDTNAAYVMLKFGNESGSIKGNFGVRYVTTEVSSTGGAQFPRFVAPNPATPPAFDPPRLFTPTADRAFMNFGSYEASAGAEHSHVLPSLNLRFGLNDEQFLRFAASRALARPDMGLYKYYYNITEVEPSCAAGNVTYAVPGDCTSAPVAYTPRYTAGVGNPELKPTTSDNLDFTFEWYFSSSGSFTTALFYKRFHDYVTNASYTLDFTNNGVTRPVTVTGPVNADGAKIAGVEVAYQTFFEALPAPWNGLGLQANATYVDNKGVGNSGLTTVSGTGGTLQDATISFTDLPLEGFSDKSYNLVLMFEQPKYSARLAWNWRSDYLISQSDCCIKLPIWQDAYGQLDASAHYKPTESWDIFLDVQNLTKAETVLRQQVNQEGLLLPRSWFTNDLRLQLGVRYRIQ